MRNKRIALVAAAAVLLAAREANADRIPILHVRNGGVLKTERGSELNLPPGYYLDEETWQERDLEMRRLQEQEVRLDAENRSLRSDAKEYPWGTIAIVATVGILVGGGMVAWQLK